MPVAAAIAVCTLLGLIFTKEKRDFSITPEAGALIAFMCWMCVTLPFSFNVADSFEMWKRVMKIDFMILVTLILLYSKKHLIYFISVVVGSIGFYGVKGGAFTLLTGGAYRVWGPKGTFIEGNNELALALIIISPLAYFLISQITSKWRRLFLLFAILLCVAAALGSYSRGALVAVIAMALAFWWYGGRRFGVLIGILVVAWVAMMFMPENWFDRMNSIAVYQEDSSAMGRINAWWMAWNLAANHFFGGGFEIYRANIFALYAPDPMDVHAAHSIYFQVLGEHGFVGLLLFLLLWGLVWWKAAALRTDAMKSPETKWIADLSAMCQVSLVGYAVGGAFLSLAYFDLPYDILVIVVLARRCLANDTQLIDGRSKIDPVPQLSGGRA